MKIRETGMRMWLWHWVDERNVLLFVIECGSNHKKGFA